MRIHKLTAQGFRGFNNKQQIALDSNVILVYGLNGAGKSSFTEALEWLFFGEISRQRLSRCRSEYQYEEYLRNLFYDGSETPYVEIEGFLADKKIVLRKEITPTKERYFVNGKEVSNFSGLGLNLESYFRPMLAQTEIKALVDSEQKDRWEQLSSILGQDDLTRLRENLVLLKNNKRSEGYKKQELMWQSLINEVDETPSLVQLSTAVKTLDADALLTKINLLTGVLSKTLKDSVIAVKAQQKKLLNTELGKRVTEISYKDSLELTEFLDQLINQLDDLEQSSIASTKEGHDHNYLKFLEIGRSLAKPPVCPFCSEDTLTNQKLTTINKELEKGESAQTAKAKFDTTKQAINLWTSSFVEKIKAFLPSQQELKIISQKLLDIGQDAIAAKVQDFEKNSETFIKNSFGEIKLGVDDRFSYLENKYFHKNPVDETVPQKLTKVKKSIVSQQQDLILAWEALKADIADKLPLVGKVDQEEIKKLIILEKIISFFVKAEGFSKKTSLLRVIDSARAKLEEHEKSEVARLLKEHANEIRAYYKKLNPGDEIHFSGIEVKGGVRRQAKLKAKAFGKDVNPVTFFSEAHTNSLALSIYFPQRVDRNISWDTVVLDDPVQSMDENHSQALIDILADISKSKQVIILTHSKSFFRRLSARFRQIKPKIYSFYNNEANGPSISLDEGETLAHLDLVEEHCKKASPKELEIASQQLRKAIESVCFEFLLDKGASFTKAQKIQKSGLDSLFGECEKLGLPEEETSKLKSLLDTSHSNSHAWSIADTAPGSLRTGKTYIVDIYNNYLD